jgi:AcrR family transcriptional regulator
MTFYKYFPNKLELAKTVFNLVINEGMQKWDELIQAPMDGAEKIQKLVLMKPKEHTTSVANLCKIFTPMQSLS